MHLAKQHIQWVIAGVLIAVLAMFVAVMIWYRVGLDSRDGATSAWVTIEEGQGVSEIAKTLKDAGVIRSKGAFSLKVWHEGAASKLQAGTYFLKFGTVDDVLTTLIEGNVYGDWARLTIPEGYRNNEIVERLQEMGYIHADDFAEQIADIELWRASYSFLVDAPTGASLEGFLFPDTYFIELKEPADELIHEMLGRFGEQWESLSGLRSGTQYSTHELVTLASIVEKEGNNEESFRNIADVFLKRLENGMKLESDATINYITRSGRARSSAADLAIDDACNTYQNTGLPPCPIANAGLLALRAVLDPIANDYFYFLTDANGGVHYARTYQEHLQNRALYLD